MNIEEIKKRKKEIEEKFGLWTVDNIALGDGISTKSNAPNELEPKASEWKSLPDDEKFRFQHLKQAPSLWQGQSPPSSRLKRILQIVSDICQKPWKNLRILDLACLEGGFSIELALRGASVIGIEGREPNITKARFPKEVLSLTNVDFIQDDVRNISPEKYGRFDVVLCLGILYHLNQADVFSFLEKIEAICDHLVVIDTEISSNPTQSCTYKGKTYWGAIAQEHKDKDSEEEKLEHLWQSLDNVESFIFTRFSLFNFLQHTGFSSVYECVCPPVLGAGTRATFVAIKGTKVGEAIISPGERVEEYSEIDSGKRDSELHVLSQIFFVRLGLRLSRFLNKVRKRLAPRR